MVELGSDLMSSHSRAKPIPVTTPNLNFPLSPARVSMTSTGFCISKKKFYIQRDLVYFPLSLKKIINLTVLFRNGINDFWDLFFFFFLEDRSETLHLHI